MRGDSAQFIVRSGSRSQIQRDSVARGTFPLLEVSVGLEESLVRRARRLKATALAVPVLYIASGGYAPVAYITIVGVDSATLRIDGVVAHLRIDDQGRIIGGRYDTPDNQHVDIGRVSCQAIDKLLRPQR